VSTASPPTAGSCAMPTTASPPWPIAAPNPIGALTRSLADVMLEERARAGLSGPGRPKVELTPEGFVFNGQPVTSPRYWQTLVAELTPQRAQAAKTLVA
jgi:hypothetical protein